MKETLPCQMPSNGSEDPPTASVQSPVERLETYAAHTFLSRILEFLQHGYGRWKIVQGEETGR